MSENDIIQNENVNLNSKNLDTTNNRCIKNSKAKYQNQSTKSLINNPSMLFNSVFDIDKDNAKEERLQEIIHKKHINEVKLKD